VRRETQELHEAWGRLQELQLNERIAAEEAAAWRDPPFEDFLHFRRPVFPEQRGGPPDPWSTDDPLCGPCPPPRRPPPGGGNGGDRRPFDCADWKGRR